MTYTEYCPIHGTPYDTRFNALGCTDCAAKVRAEMMFGKKSRERGDYSILIRNILGIGLWLWMSYELATEPLKNPEPSLHLVLHIAFVVAIIINVVRIKLWWDKKI